MSASARRDAQKILSALAQGGGRRTASRQAIVEAILESKRHVTADDVIQRVKRRFPSVNMSTVYRTLERLEELGVLDHVHLGHGRAVYHLTDEDHQHLVCERCERVVELPASKLKPFLRTVEREYRFEIDRRHFAIVGLCDRCRATSRAGGSPAAGRRATSTKTRRRTR